MVGCYLTSSPTPTSITLAPGGQVDEQYDATSFTYGQYEFLRPNGGAVLQLTCLEHQTTGSEIVTTCTAVR
jgi:hypothetical protein